MANKALIIYRVDKGIRSNAGVVQKLSGQVEALISLGWDVDYIIHDGSKIYKNQEVIGIIPSYWGSIGVKWQFWESLKSALNKEYDLFLIRYSLMIPPQFHCIRSIRKANPKSKILLDMPTYPYEDEWKGLKGSLGLYWDRKYRVQLSPYVDAVTHSGREESIFEIRTIPISNGISDNLISESSNVKKRTDALTLIAVGKWQFWHGLDRLIQGIKSYLDRPHPREIHLHIVGEGPEGKALKYLVDDLDIGSSITFHGALVGKTLLNLLDQSHIAIGTLGLHRKKVVFDSSLKHRLYCARGIPMLLSSPDRAFDSQLRFVLYTTPDETDIDINALIDWYDRLDTEKISEKMITFAKDYLTWNIKMQELLAAL